MIPEPSAYIVGMSTVRKKKLKTNVGAPNQSGVMGYGLAVDLLGKRSPTIRPLARNACGYRQPLVRALILCLPKE